MAQSRKHQSINVKSISETPLAAQEVLPPLHPKIPRRGTHRRSPLPLGHSQSSLLLNAWPAIGQHLTVNAAAIVQRPVQRGKKSRNQSINQSINQHRKSHNTYTAVRIVDWIVFTNLRSNRYNNEGMCLLCAELEQIVLKIPEVVSLIAGFKE
jgi:hypothetical protein